VDETTSSIRGKINITESINQLSFINKKLNCTYDVFSVNSYLNKIIKTTLTILLKESTIKKHKRGIKNILLYFRDVDYIDTNNINWQIRYDRNNQDYRMIIGICYLTLKGLLQSDRKGDKKLMKFFDDQRMSRLYEKFILNYYRKEHSYLKAYSPQIEWQLDDDFGEMLPRMQTDITLEYEDKILIIDAKYYSNTMQSYYDTKTIHSHNLYQIFTYVKNKEVEVDNEVSGMLLYARTREEVQPDHDYLMSGNKISVKTLDLNCEFKEIAAQLNQIVSEHFGA
jgi:5-methylcytosine-specific restriction enzyme subunit McrC